MLWNLWFPDIVVPEASPLRIPADCFSHWRTFSIRFIVRKKASENSINVYIKSVNNKIAENRVNKLEIEDGVYNILSSGNICLVYDSSTCVSELKLSLTNSYPTSGEIEIKDGKVYNYDLYIDGKEYKKN